MAINPKDVLNEAREAFKANDFQTALERYEYFFDHALDDDSSGLYGVRLSYCLDEWKKLGQKYPAAMERLKKKAGDSLGRVVN